MDPNSIGAMSGSPQQNLYAAPTMGGALPNAGIGSPLTQDQVTPSGPASGLYGG